MKKFFWAILPIILIVGALVGGVFIYRAGAVKTETIQEEPSPTAPSIETPEPSPPALDLNREDLRLQILNGSGVAGAATEVKEFLESLGYKNIEIGDADSYGYEKTEVSIKEDKEAYLKQLVADLSDGIRVSENIKTLDAESEFDAVVILGKE